MQTKGRRPDPRAVSSAVFRMHKRREACTHWQPAYFEDTPITPRATIEEDFLPDGILNQFLEQNNVPPRLRKKAPQAPANQAELDQLKNQLLQKDQMITSLQQQQHHLLDEIKQLKKEMTQLRQIQHQSLSIPSEHMDYFNLLGVNSNSSPKELKQAYRSKVKLYHPDKFIALAQRLNAAYDTLKSPLKKKEYLRELNNEQS